MASKRDDGRSVPDGEHAATRKVETLAEAFAEELLRRGSAPESDPAVSAHERTTAPELPDDPDATGAHADRVALDAARLIVVGSDPALPAAGAAPAPGRDRTPPSAPPIASASPLRPARHPLVLVGLAVLGLVTVGVVLLASC